MKKRLKFEETLCSKERCIHRNIEDQICNLNGMVLNDNLHIGFACGNLNDPDARKTYFPKPEKLDVRIELIAKDDQKFQEFQDLFRSEIERILANSDDLNLQSLLNRDYNLPKTWEIVFAPGYFHKFGQYDEIFEEKREKIISLLNYLLPYSDDNIEIWVALDSRIYFISLEELYDCLFESAVELYIRNKTEFSDLLSELINDWRESLKSRIIKYELIIPLKGLYFSDLDWNKFIGKRIDDPELIEYREKSTFYGLNFKNYSIKINNIEKDCSISLKPTDVHSIFRKDKSISPKFNHTFLSAISYFPLFFRGISRAPNIEDSELWRNLKYIFQSFYVYGIKLSIGKPYYKFPWWISKKLIKRFSFAVPNWLKTNTMWLKPVEPLIPDFFISNIGLDFDFNKERKHSGDIFFGKSKILNQGMQSKGGGGYTRSLSLIKNISALHQKLSNPTSSKINFKNKTIQFILDRLLQLGQCNDIEDAILTACIILESIGTSERTRMLMIVSIIMSDSQAEFMTYFKKRVKLYDTLYGVRNSIIHGYTNIDDKFRNFGRIILNKEDLSKIEAYEKKNLIILWLFETVAEIIKNIIVKDIDIQKLSESNNYTNYLDFKS